MTENVDIKDFGTGAITFLAASLSIANIPLQATATETTVVSNLKKGQLGQFFTEKKCWLREHIKKFIAESGSELAYDPFAGTGCMLDAVSQEISNIQTIKGLDIDESLGWKKNDSLLSISKEKDAIIITNPPYLTKYSASRKKIGNTVKKYFDISEYDDLYLIALDRMLEAQKNVVAIIPETFINSPYKQKNKLHSITILEENPFDDTDVPVIVACFDSREKNFDEIKIYKNDRFICSLAETESTRIFPNNDLEIFFNRSDAWLAVRCVDSTDPNDRIRFAFKDEIDYNWDAKIKVSSRLLTLIKIDIPEGKQKLFIDECNRILNNLRERSHDIIFSPFKGNTKNGIRWRRLDFQTCRAISGQAYLHGNGACFWRSRKFY